MKIIWVDDDTDIIGPVVEPLLQDGHDISQFRTIHDALDKVEAFQTCNLILLDMIIPPGKSEDQFGDYSGVSLLRLLREEHGIVAPVIVFSVVDPKKVEGQLDTLNVAEYVRKPALPSELKDMVDVVLGI